jgi:STAM-binding protein
LEASPSHLPGITPDAPQAHTGLRKLVVYGEMFQAFMRVAASNTNRRIETCAILSGSLSKNTFHVTTMIVPKQEGTTDTCNATNEEELFEYQMANNLLTLGWIHTHPTQDCFLSSVDLHTHCTYQLLLPEAIAIVISPMHSPNFGIFRVSDPPGMQILQKCTLRGFHAHNSVETMGRALYTLCDHVELVWGSKNFKIVDLR